MTLHHPDPHDRTNLLTAMHSVLEDYIREEQSRPLPNTFQLQALKRLRLHVKDRLRNSPAKLAGSAMPQPAGPN